MQRQNRNTPVYNQELSGKTNYLVANLVPLGRNNAISTEDLLKLSGFESMTDLQRQADLELENGEIFCFDLVDGGWIPKGKVEFEEFISFLDNRQKKILKSKKSNVQHVR